MDQQKIDLPALQPGEAWTVKVCNQLADALAVIVQIKTAGGTVISLPLALNGDVRIVAGADTGATVVTFDMRGDEIGVARTLN